MNRKRWPFAAKLFTLLLFLAVISLTYYSVGYAVARWIGVLPAAGQTRLVPNLIADFIGTLLFMLTAGLINVFARPGRRRELDELNTALRQIARGDFNIILPERRGDDDWNGEFRENIKRMAEELKQVENVRQEFISTVSHEIQSPLTSIRGFASALRDERLTPGERRHYLDIIEMESMRLSKLGDNLLRLTALEGEGPALDPRPYRLDQQIRKVALTLEPQWLDKELELELDLAEVTVSGDEQLLDQVWINLLHNAIKFTPKGGTIRLFLGERDGKKKPESEPGMPPAAADRAADVSSGESPEPGVREAVFRIRDSGPGIPQEDQLRIFERFYRGDKSRLRTVEGSGLGLSVVKKIVDLHGGRIAVQSLPGEGAEFEVLLPGR